MIGLTFSLVFSCAKETINHQTNYYQKAKHYGAWFYQLQCPNSKVNGFWSHNEFYECISRDSIRFVQRYLGISWEYYQHEE